MEFVNFEELIKAKVAECDEWLGGEEDARKALADAEEALVKAHADVEKARVELSDYNPDNIERVKAYRKELRDHLGIVDEPEVIVAKEPIATIPVALTDIL